MLVLGNFFLGWPNPLFFSNLEGSRFKNNKYLLYTALKVVSVEFNLISFNFFSELFDDDCVIFEDINQNWDKVTKSVIQNGEKKRRRTYLHCKKCNLLFRSDTKKDVDKRNQFHICFEKVRQLSLMDVAKPSVEYSHYNLTASCHLSMSQATSEALYSFYKESFQTGYTRPLNRWKNNPPGGNSPPYNKTFKMSEMVNEKLKMNNLLIHILLKL